MIRFQRIGRTNDPAFRIVVLEKERAAKSGRITDQVGTYNPRTKALTLDEAKIKEWISKGAQPTGSIHNLLITKGVLTGKKINVLPRKHPVKPAETASSVGQPAPQAATEKVEEAPPEAEVVAEAVPEEVAAPEAPAEAPVA